MKVTLGYVCVGEHNRSASIRPTFPTSCGEGACDGYDTRLSRITEQDSKPRRQIIASIKSIYSAGVARISPHSSIVPQDRTDPPRLPVISRAYRQ
jgi:hypothetical protein